MHADIASAAEADAGADDVADGVAFGLVLLLELEQPVSARPAASRMAAGVMVVMVRCMLVIVDGRRRL
ncbi:hypothetical protein [Streptomyces sp. NPDC004546]|uniref:hypothetical protein n=1 Tax=Streptomyces sp. NPDC004546 TaxID=3154282 RepID=UPI0033B91C14